VEKVLADDPGAPIEPRERELLRFVAKVNGSAPEIRKEDLQALKSAGWSEEALYDAITVVSLFNFYNRWCDAAGVHAMPRELHRKSANFSARRGYVVVEPDPPAPPPPAREGGT
jgi:hypothetical protein